MTPDPSPTPSWRNIALLALGVVAVVLIALLLSQLDTFQRRSEVPSNGVPVNDVDATLAAGELATIYLPGEATPVPRVEVTPTLLEQPTAMPTAQTPTIEARSPCSETAVMWSEYIVRSMDTWSSLAERFGVAEEVLREANCLAGESLLEGQQIVVPQQMAWAATNTQQCQVPAGWKPYELEPGDTLSQLARQHRISLNKLLRANCMQSPDMLIPSVIYLP